jgi:hypothetical protein
MQLFATQLLCHSSEQYSVMKTSWTRNLLLLCCAQLCVRLCEGYKQQYIALRDAAKLDNPDKVRRASPGQRGCLRCFSAAAGALLHTVWGPFVCFHMPACSGCITSGLFVCCCCCTLLAAAV